MHSLLCISTILSLYLSLNQRTMACVYASWDKVTALFQLILLLFFSLFIDWIIFWSFWKKNNNYLFLFIFCSKNNTTMIELHSLFSLPLYLLCSLRLIINAVFIHSLLQPHTHTHISHHHYHHHYIDDLSKQLRQSN